MISWRRLAAWLLGLSGLMAGPCLAQAPGLGGGAGTQWQQTRGAAADVAVTLAGDVYALDGDGRLWRAPEAAAATASGTAPNWALQAGRYARLRATQDGGMWAWDGAGRLYRQQGSLWAAVSDGVGDVAVSPDGLVWHLLADGRLVHAASGAALEGPLNSGRLVRVASDEHGLLWVMAEDGRAWRGAGGAWREMASAQAGLRDLAIAADGTVMGLDGAGQVLQLEAVNGTWSRYPLPSGVEGQVGRIALGASGLPWVLTRSGVLLYERPVDAPRARTASSPAAFTRLLSWRTLGGQSIAVAVGPDGTAFSLNAEGAAWQWQGDNRWSALGGRFAAIAAGSRGSAWAWAPEGGGRGTVHALEGGFWRALPGSVRVMASGPASERMSSSAGRTVWAVSLDGQLQRWDAPQRQWERLGGVPTEPLALAVSARGAAWIIGADGKVWTQEPPRGKVAAQAFTGWHEVSGILASSLAIGPEDTVYAATQSDAALVWLDRRDMQWKPASGSAIALAVGPGGAPWIVTPNRQLLASGRFLREQAERLEAARATATPPRPVLTITPAAAPSTNKPLSFDAIFSADLGFIDIGIGGNGSVFAVGSQGGLFCFSNASRRFLLASSGQARRVAVSSDGQPTLLNASGVVSRFQKGAWQAIPDFLGQDISIGPDGQVWALSRAGEAHRLLAGRFEPVSVQSADAPFRGWRIAGANGGVHWLVTEDKRLLRCERGQCSTRLSGVQDVSVAPDNTVFVLDLMSKLRRGNAIGTSFDLLQGTSGAPPSAMALSVGPQGLPWLISAQGKVSSSGLFSPFSRSVNTDSCVLPFAQSPAPVEPPLASLRVADAVGTVAPGGSLDLLTLVTLNGRRPSMDEVALTLNEAPPSLSLREASLLIASNLASGAGVQSSYTVCPRRAGGGCASARIALSVLLVPGAPNQVAAVAGNGSASVSFVPPTASPGAPSVYLVTANPGGVQASGSASPVVVSGLSNGTAYTFTVVGINASGQGPSSVASPPVTPSTVAGAPTGVVATPGNTQASVAFAAPSSNGGSAITAYTVTANPGGATASGAASPLVVSGLSNGTAYTFTVRASNGNGAGAPSLASAPVTPRSVAGAPTAVVATPGNGQATVAFAPPVSNGGSAITGYTATASPGGATVSGLASPLIVSGLTNGTAYTFSVRAENAAGIGVPSDPSAPVTPMTVPGAPTSVIATPGNAQASVAFAVPSSNGGSAITTYTVTASPGGATASGTASPLVVTGLSNGTAYSFRVVAVNVAGPGAPSSASPLVTPSTVPGAPTGVVATRGNAQASVAFAAPSSDGGSPITVYTVTASPGGATATGTASPVVVSGLANGTAYSFTVRASNSTGAGLSSLASAPVTPATVPGAPTSVADWYLSTNQVLVRFNPPVADGGSPITGYRVVPDPVDPALNIVPVSSSGAPGSITYAVFGLTFTRAYTFRVVAINAVGESVLSGPTSVVNPSTRPLFPGAIVGVPGDGQLTLNMLTPSSDGGSPITSYTVDIEPNPANGEPTRRVSGPSNSIVVTGLTNGVSYGFIGWANNANGRGAGSPYQGATPSPAPGAPTGVSATRGDAQATVSFSAPAGSLPSPITSYTVTASPGGATATGTASPITVSGLTNGTAYSFTVQARNVVGLGSPSAPSAAVTPATVPSAPTAVTAELFTTSDVWVDFMDPASNGGAPITDFIVTASPATPGLVIEASADFRGNPKYRVGGLVFTQPYTFSVRARNAVGDSAPSTPSWVVNPSTRPLYPGAITATAGNGSITVNLLTPTSDGGSPITSYTVEVFPLTGGAEPWRVVTGPSNSILVTGLTNGVAYCYHGWANNANGRGATSPACAVGGTTPSP